MKTFSEINKNNIDFIIKFYSSPEDIKSLALIEKKIKEMETPTDQLSKEEAELKRDNFLSNLQKRFVASSIEWESKNFKDFITSAETQDNNLDLLIESFLNKKLPYKKIKLYEHFNIKVFTNSNYPGVISYKSKENIESELWKIYYEIFGEPSGNTLVFINNKIYTKEGNTWKLGDDILSLSDEFLILDGQPPKFLKDKEVVYYSALYNYIPDQLRLKLSENTTVANLISTISSCNIDLSDQNFDDNWLDKQEKFQRFLVEIYRGTINY